jgi:hypothetical protein
MARLPTRLFTTLAVQKCPPPVSSPLTDPAVVPAGNSAPTAATPVNVWPVGESDVSGRRDPSMVAMASSAGEAADEPTATRAAVPMRAPAVDSPNRRRAPRGRVRKLIRSSDRRWVLLRQAPRHRCSIVI